ncbi:acetyl-CoA carboxylase biotin carboxyl carrier protein subunit [Lewinella sp. IMCC34191]|uniref:acetyl-CoA carboxylase biotin carboxyl carrier protein subunit n=1 Tax=Lewinella sp. IMCC34191 TaxID=2259172 RepID=UPI000E2585D2|nr:acetyl-CoA carboxylase biotin carboxyl carrier protein subunit [Lewinella sp. IMCC34191]
MENYTAAVNDESFAIEGGELTALDIVGPLGGAYHLIRNGKSYRCRLIDLDRITKTLTVAIGEREFTVRLSDKYDQLVERLGLSVNPESATNEVTAPMPGLILDVLVEVGQAVEGGTPLLVLEAMKMENVLKADGEGTVKAIRVKKGEAVEKRQLLIEME